MGGRRVRRDGNAAPSLFGHLNFLLQWDCWIFIPASLSVYQAFFSGWRDGELARKNGRPPEDVRVALIVSWVQRDTLCGLAVTSTM
jgi:hypothetical protein